ncbi:MAG: DEAD/DEAH box helicase [Chitinophagales bacterium]|nr:DEAD/DEAH box helicase [Chitinophagales bacterium]
MTTFKELNIIQPILAALQTQGYTHPTPIQQQAIPHILQGKDLLGCAQTGTGKTAAFAIPILQLLSQSPKRSHKAIKCLVLTPTRELAIQIGDNFSAYGAQLKLSHTTIFGGVPQGKQVQALRAGVDILIATPGRLLDLMQQRFISLSELEILVLDEADRMLDMGFINDVKKVLVKVPAKRQTLFFSATMPPEIQGLANTILKNPAEVKVTPVSSTVEIIQQSLYYVDKKEKKNLLMHILKDSSITRSLVFTRTKHGADKLVKDLQKNRISAAAIHGNKSQNARQRALNDFKDNRIRVLVATDIAARGIDIDELPHVVNYELPDVPETYVHRIGRTGRAGADGIAVAFCDVEELDNLKDIQKLIGLKIPVVEDHPHPATTERINTPKPEPRKPQRRKRPNGKGNNGKTRPADKRW